MTQNIWIVKINNDDTYCCFLSEDAANLAVEVLRARCKDEESKEYYSIYKVVTEGQDFGEGRNIENSLSNEELSIILQ